MEYRIFGKTGMEVSVMTLGTWGMGGAGWDVYEDEVKIDAIDHIVSADALRAGVKIRKGKKVYHRAVVR